MVRCRRAPILARALLAAALVACRRSAPPPPPTEAPVATTPPTAVREPPAPSEADAGEYAGPWLGATVIAAPIWSETEVPNDHRSERDTKSLRLGYLRYGERVPVIPEPHRKPNCVEGWYELLSGGFVCGRFATLDLEHPKFKLAKGPDLDGALPYTYGVNLFNGTPLYRQLPSRAQRQKYEPWLFRPRKPKVDETALAMLGDAGVVDPAADDPDADVPWWEREVPEGGPPQVTLEDLEESGPVARRMVKGFYLSLDHELEANGVKWWHTVNNLSAPADRIILAKPITEFHGVWLGKDDGTFATKNVPSRRIDKLPVAFVMNYYAKRWTLDDARKKATAGEGTLDHFDAVGLTGNKVRAGGYEYWETDEGWWLRAIDMTMTEPGPPPSRLGENEKWIDVNLKRQTLVAFEGTQPVFATLVSSGRNEHETPPGSFRIREKHISATMDGDADTAADGPYSIEDVPYIEYFNAGYALHGAFWHGSFGSVKSHGCVNLAPWDAKALFGWTEPQLPEGWHAVFSTKEKPGTRVILHERAAGTCEGPMAGPPQCPDHT